MRQKKIPKNYAESLDDIDYKILSLLQKNARMSAKEIASHVYLSSTSVTTRIDKMVAAGIITDFTIQIDPLSLGFYTKAFINVEVAPDQKNEFYPYIDGCKNVVQCNCVTGDFSMLLETIFHNTMELDIFIGELQKFGKTKTLIVFSTSVEHREVYLNQESSSFL